MYDVTLQILILLNDPACEREVFFPFYGEDTEVQRG